MKKCQKSFCGEACPHKLIASVDDVVAVELLATTLAEKHITSMLPNFCAG